MTYKTGIWGNQAKERSKKRNAYFKAYRRKHPQAYQFKDDSNPTFGRLGELEAIRILKGAIDKNKRGRSIYDIEWMGNKIEVKTSNRKEYKYINKHYKWKFLLKQRGLVDFFIFLCFIDKKLKYVFLVPDKELGDLKNLTICESTINRFQKYQVI